MNKKIEMPPIREEPKTDAEILRQIMETQQLKQNDLAEDFKGQSTVSDILNGKRRLSRNQIQLLCERFALDPKIFFERKK